MFKGVLTGKEIKKRNKDQSLLLDERKYEYYESGKITNGIINSEAKLINNKEENDKEEKRKRVKELKNTIPEKEMIKDILNEKELKQLTDEKKELKKLLGL